MSWLIVHIRIRLATNLYSEHLLDRDHYLDWIVSGLENSPHSRLPMWILVAQITWADLVRSRKHGRRLVYTLLGHLSAVRFCLLTCMRRSDAKADLLAEDLQRP